MAGEPLGVCQVNDVRRDLVEALSAETHDAGSFAEVVGVEAAGETGCATSWKHVRRTGRIIPDGNWRKWAEENCPGVVDFIAEGFGVSRLNVQMLRGQGI